MTETDKGGLAVVPRRRERGDDRQGAGFAPPSVAEYIRNAGGIRPTPRCVSPGQLSLEDREERSPAARRWLVPALIEARATLGRSVEQPDDADS